MLFISTQSLLNNDMIQVKNKTDNPINFSCPCNVIAEKQKKSCPQIVVLTFPFYFSRKLLAFQKGKLQHTYSNFHVIDDVNSEGKESD